MSANQMIVQGDKYCYTNKEIDRGWWNKRGQPDSHGSQEGMVMVKKIAGYSALVTGIVSFLISFVSYPYIVGSVLVVAILILLVVGSFILAFRRDYNVLTRERPYHFRQHFLGFPGILLAVIIFIFLLMTKTTRDFAVTAILGTSTPTPSPTATPTATPTQTPVPTSTPITVIAKLNVSSSVSRDRNTVYTARLSIDPLEYGNVQVEAPFSLWVNQSGLVQLLLIPDSAMISEQHDLSPTQTIGADISHELESLSNFKIPDGYIISASDRIKIYPIMSAKLDGVNFDISPENKQTFPVISSSPVKIIWTVSPKSSRSSLLTLSISIPVIVSEDDQQFVDYPITTIPVDISVEGTGGSAPVAPSGSILLYVIYLICLLVLVGSFIELLIWVLRKNKKNKTNKTKLISVDDNEFHVKERF